MSKRSKGSNYWGPMRKYSHNLIAFLLATAVCAGANAQKNSSMSENEKIMREFIAAWSNLDATELASYFTDDGVYHNMPSGAVQGRENIEQFIGGFIRPWESTDWEILNLVVDGDVVIVERLDKTVVAGNPVDLPCLGIFELENGKIKVWRDYFDLSTYTDALSQALQQ